MICFIQKQCSKEFRFFFTNSSDERQRIKLKFLKGVLWSTHLMKIHSLNEMFYFEKWELRMTNFPSVIYSNLFLSRCSKFQINSFMADRILDTVVIQLIPLLNDTWNLTSWHFSFQYSWLFKSKFRRSSLFPSFYQHIVRLRPFRLLLRLFHVV